MFCFASVEEWVTMGYFVMHQETSVFLRWEHCLVVDLQSWVSFVEMAAKWVWRLNSPHDIRRLKLEVPLM